MLFDTTFAGASPDDALSFIVEILQSFTEYSIIGKDLNGRILLWNEGARRLYGYEPEEVIGRAQADILHTPEDIAAGKPAAILQEALRRGKWEGLLTRLRKDGSRFVTRAVVTPRFDTGGLHTGYLLVSKDATNEVAAAHAEVGAMLDVTELKRTEKSLQESYGRLRQLSGDLLRAQDYERRRIARELHDSTAQLLSALSINLSRLQKPGLEPDRRRQMLSEASELVAACSVEIRTVTCLLHPPLLDELGLASALQSYAQGFSQRTGIQVEIKLPPDFGRLSSELETTLFRIVQEGLANVHKHSGSPLAVIHLERDPHEVRLVLQDRGHGLLEALRKTKGFVRFGIGIIGMRERAEQLGGRLELNSNDNGATLTVTLPLPLIQPNEENANTVSG
jgi:PAS domain S-box-containing protein